MHRRWSRARTSGDAAWRTFSDADFDVACAREVSRTFQAHLVRPQITTTLEDPVTMEFLFRTTLLARFTTRDAETAPRSGSLAYRNALDRHAANQHLAESIGWTGFALEREGIGGCLFLRGISSPGRDLGPEDRITWTVSRRVPPDRNALAPNDYDNANVEEP
jgi:hypothetical protein